MNNQSLIIISEKNPSQDDLNVLSEGICAEAYNKRGLTKIEHFCFFAKDKDLQIKGGIEGVIYYGCMYIDELWIDENYRDKGYATKLMLEAEALARLQDCGFITLNTMYFEAKPFYEKLGYQVEFKREGYAKASVLYSLRKNLL